MSYYQHNTDEIAAYFHISPAQLQEDIKKSLEIGKKVNGNIPQIMEILLTSKDMSPVAKLMFVYSLGRSTMQIEMRARMDKEIRDLIQESIKKGMEIGASLPPGSAGTIELSNDESGNIRVDINTDQSAEDSPESPAITETKKDHGDPMYR